MSSTENLPTQPQGELLLRTLAMPADTNPNQDIFGGWIMAQMDIGGGILAAEIAQGRIVTVAVQQMNFIRPVKVGNVVCCYGRCVRVGNTSLQIKIEVWVKTLMNDKLTEERRLVTEAVFTYVAIDAGGNPRPVPKSGNPKLFDATLALRREPLSRQGLMAALARWPWITLKVLLGIYWQALRLFIKRTPIFSHPETH